MKSMNVDVYLKSGSIMHHFNVRSVSSPDAQRWLIIRHTDKAVRHGDTWYATDAVEKVATFRA